MPIDRARLGRSTRASVRSVAGCSLLMGSASRNDPHSPAQLTITDPTSMRPASGLAMDRSHIAREVPPLPETVSMFSALYAPTGAPQPGPNTVSNTDDIIAVNCSLSPAVNVTGTAFSEGWSGWWPEVDHPASYSAWVSRLIPSQLGTPSCRRTPAWAWRGHAVSSARASNTPAGPTPRRRRASEQPAKQRIIALPPSSYCGVE